MEFIRLLAELFRRYAIDNWPFLIAHLIVLWFYLIMLFKVIKETKELEEFKIEKRERDSHSEGCLSVLQGFVVDCDELGAKGFFVPMTDFSDRLDSITDGLIAGLHDRSNLFLVVGIAGTMFGVFEFATGVLHNLSTLPSNELVPKLTELLSTSMGKAFPVGIVGIALTLLFQVFSAYPEERLRNALSQAIQQAFLHRKKRLAQSLYQGSVIEEATKAIQRSVEGLQNIETTLANSLEPLIRKFEESFNPIVQEFGKQVGRTLDSVVQQFDSLQAATKDIRNSLGGLDSVAKHLETDLKQAPAVLDNTLRIQEKQKEWINSFEDNNNHMLERIKGLQEQTSTLLAKIEQVPEYMKQKTTEVFSDFAATAEREWLKKSDEFVDRVASRHVVHLENMEGISGKIPTAISDALTGFDELSRSHENLMHRVLEAVEDRIRRSHPQIIDSVDEIMSKLVQTADNMQQVHREFGRWGEEIEQFYKTLQDVHKEIEQGFKKLMIEFMGQVEAVRSKPIFGDGHLVVEKISETNKILGSLPTVAVVRFFSKGLGRGRNKSNLDR